jgi:hypothetical protein
MITSVITLIRDRYGWEWKPESLELLVEKLMPGHGYWDIPVGDTVLRYQIRTSMVALGGVLDSDKPAQALMRYRFAAGDKCFYKYICISEGKHPLASN